MKTKHYLYSTWKGMKGRCNIVNHVDYPNYGGRGITVCDRWLNDFWSFVSDMGDKPRDYTLDRKDNDGNYTPSNCRWADSHTQAMNKRVKKDNVCGVRGISVRPNGTYMVRKVVNGKRVCLGTRVNLADAKKLYESGIKDTREVVRDEKGRYIR